MDPLELVDDLYEEFAAGLGGDLAVHARDLPRALRLSPVKDTPWSAVFKHEITLAAPALFADALPGASIFAVREAVRAHMFSVIDAFGTDRVEDGQVFLTSDGLRVLERVRAERDASMARLASSAPATDLDIDPAAMDRATTRALERERDLLRSGAGVDFAAYESLSLAKQSAGVVATCVLARIAGASPPRYRAIQQALESVALALQMHDDVVDWEDDQSRGGAWVVCVMRGSAPVGAVAETTEIASLRAQVLGCDVLLRMLRRARWHMRAAAARARALGATRAAAWAATRERSMTVLVSAESRNAGYAIRSHALSAWATEVLA
ncbi:MAG: hypothetical protein ACRENE_22025 [Polyangiaceae bacterium]